MPSFVLLNQNTTYNMYKNTIDEVSAHIQQPVHNQQMQPMD